MEQSIFEKLDELSKDLKEKSVIVGRVWIKNKVLSGYVVIAPGVIMRFGSNLDFNPSFLYLSKKR